MKKPVNKFSNYVVLILGCTVLLMACKDSTVNPEDVHIDSELSNALNAPGTVETRTVAKDNGNPFIGSWKNTDPLDGSEIQVAIANDAPGGAKDLVWRERKPTLCHGVGGVLRAETRLVGDRLRLFDPVIRCPQGETLEFPFPDRFAFTHSPETNTLDFWILDANGDLDILFVPCFYRSGSPDSCAD